MTMVRVIRKRGPKPKPKSMFTNGRIIDARLISLPLGQVYLVPRQKLVTAEQAEEELRQHKDESFVTKTRSWA